MDADTEDEYFCSGDTNDSEDDARHPGCSSELSCILPVPYLVHMKPNHRSYRSPKRLQRFVLYKKISLFFCPKWDIIQTLCSAVSLGIRWSPVSLYSPLLLDNFTSQERPNAEVAVDEVEEVAVDKVEEVTVDKVEEVTVDKVEEITWKQGG